MRAVRDSETAAASIGVDVVRVKTRGVRGLGRCCAGLAGGLFAPLTGFVTPKLVPVPPVDPLRARRDDRRRRQRRRPAGRRAIVGMLPELLSSLEEYRLLFFGALLLVVLWVAPDGIVGTCRRALRPLRACRARAATATDVERASFARRRSPGPRCECDGLTLAFGGVRAVDDSRFTAGPAASRAHRPERRRQDDRPQYPRAASTARSAGRILLGDAPLYTGSAACASRAPASRAPTRRRSSSAASRRRTTCAGALRRGRLGVRSRRQPPARRRRDAPRRRSLLAFVGYARRARPSRRALPHVDRRLVEIARALALRSRRAPPRRAGGRPLARGQERLAELLREIARSRRRRRARRARHERS